jgi:ankyrin repeat protein
VAAYRGDDAELRTLVGAGHDPSERDPATGWSPLMIAAAEGHLAAVSVLLEADAEVNATNPSGRSALMFAARYGYTPIAEELIRHGADVDLVPHSNPRWPALIAAAYFGHVDTVRLLVDHGADVDLRDETGKTALMWAGEQGHRQIEEALHGAAAID